VKKHFTEPQIVELTAAIAFENFRSKLQSDPGRRGAGVLPGAAEVSVIPSAARIFLCPKDPRKGSG
jgi:hypothetical protein